MGASESKIAVASAVASTPRPDPSQRPRNDRVGRLIDPRSPSNDIDRTPIQVGAALSRPSVEVESGCAVPPGDPRSPSVGITRTPVKVTVGSFARRLGMLFLSDATDTASPVPRRPPGLNDLKVEEELLGDEELGSSELLLTPHADVPTTPIQSPFIQLGEAQVEVETEAEADFSLDEAEDVEETPLHKRLSMSLITCHEGTVPVQIFAEVHQDCLQSLQEFLPAPQDCPPSPQDCPPSPQDCPLSPLPEATAELDTDAPDHPYALPSFTSDPVCPVTTSHPPTPTPAEVAIVTEDPELPEEKTDRVQVELAPEVPAVQVSPVPGNGELGSSELLTTQADVPASPIHSPIVHLEEARVEAETETVITEGPELPEEKIEGLPMEVAPEVPAAQESPVPSITLPSTNPSPCLTQQLQTESGIRCPTFDTKSPSQLVFKPQWLGKGFGATGIRARVQGRGGKGGSSSPLALRVGAKNAANENKGQPAKQKQRGKALAEGRSPLQILKQTNSPKDQPAHMKLKVSTPDRQRLGQLDHRVLTVSLDKENR